MVVEPMALVDGDLREQEVEGEDQQADAEGFDHYSLAIYFRAIAIVALSSG